MNRVSKSKVEKIDWQTFLAGRGLLLIALLAITLLLSSEQPPAWMSNRADMAAAWQKLWLYN